MPLEYLPQKHKREHKADAKQAPEPMNRILRQELVKDRHVTKQTLRTIINQGMTCGVGR